MRFSFSRIVGALAILLTLAGPSWAQQRIDQIGAAAAMSASDIIPDCQGCNNATPMVGLTPAQLITYLNTNLSLNASITTAGSFSVARLGTGAASHAVIVDVAGVSTWKVVPDCTDTGGNHLNYTQSSDAFSCGTSGGGAGSISVSGGGNTTTGVTTVAFGNGFVATPNGANTTSTVNLTVTDSTKSGDYQVAAGDMANALNLTGTHTLTAPAASSTIFAPGMGLTIAKMDAGTWTFTNSTGLTYNGPSTFPRGTQGSLIANADGTHLDWFGSAPDGTTIVLSSGQLTAAGASATSITPGTTTIVGATAPCLIENSTSTTMACAAVGTGVLTAAAINVNTNGGLLTASTAAIAANAIVTGAGSGTALTGTTPGTGVLTALGVNVGSAGALVTNGGALGTPSSGTLTSATGLPAAGVVAGALANGMTATTQSAASNDTKVATDAYVDAKTQKASIGWIATVNPNNAGVMIFPAASTLISVVGNPEVATGSAATVKVMIAASATACSAGTDVTSSGTRTIDANGTAATNQTLTLANTAVASGSRLCLQTTGTTSWTGGTGIGTITVTYTTP